MLYLVKTLDLFLSALEILLLLRVILSWLPIGYDNPIANFIRQVTEPLLAPIRRLIDKSIFGGRGMMIDFSPLIAFFIINAIQSYVKGF